ncbi:MAG: hypothetical protein EOP20_02210 [Hyphomicrobiales bacterium]|nr:MAG: hypothetical protein EOP20_02210 [Hyphomicrobiales bacterium]
MNNTRFSSLAIESFVFATLGMGLVDISSAACTMTVGNNTAYPNLSAIPWPPTSCPVTICITPGSYSVALAVQGEAKAPASELVIQPPDPQNRPEYQEGIALCNDGFKLVKKPNGVGYALPLDLPDMAGRLAIRSSSDFRAYYCSAQIPGATCAL